MRAAVYCGTRNLYRDMLTAAKSLLLYSNVEKIYFLIEDNQFPYDLPQEIETINISKQQYFTPDGPNFNSSWTYMVLIRAALSKVFPQLDTILSLDVDTIVNENISELFDIELGNNYLAAVVEPEKSVVYGYTYINMGVALLNLKYLRETGMDDRIIEALNTKFYEYNEQDCISEMCQGHIYPLRPEYNVCNYTNYEQAYCRKIIHFAAIKEWQKLPIVQQYANMKITERNYNPRLTGLDIIIPTYNNSKALEKTLHSICCYNPLVSVTVVNDCSTQDLKGYEEIKHLYPTVKFITLATNSGPGMARQEGINQTNNPYIMFIDAGDYIISPYNLDEIVDTISHNRMPDLYLWRWLNEENNQFSSEQNPLLHGWVFRRSFLRLHHITFSREGSYLNEDVGFTRACNLIINNMKLYDETPHFHFFETPVYMYTYDRDSITHKDNKEFLHTKQTKALITNAKHSFDIAMKNNVALKVLRHEASAIMVGLYLDFLRIASKHPEYLEQNWFYIRTYYLEIFQQFEEKAQEDIQIVFGQRIRALLRANTVTRTPGLNIKRFLRELKESENCPNYYLT